MASGLLLGLVGLALALAQPFWAGELIDRVQHARPIGLALVVVVGLTVAGAVCSGLQQLLLGALVERSTARWRRWFVDGFLRLPLLGRTRRGGGWFTARLVSDPPILGGFVGVGLVQSAQSAVLLIATLVVLLAMDPISIAVPLGFALASLAIALLLARPAGRRRSALQRLNGTMATQMGTMVSGARLLIASNADDGQRSRIDRDIGAAATEGTALNRLHSVAGPVTVVLMQVAYASVFVVGGWRVAERQMSFPELITFLMVFGLFQSSIHDVSTFPGSLSECRAALRHCAEAREVDTPHTPPPAGEARSAGLTHESGAHAAVRFSDVRFAYTHDGAAALDGASFRAPAGARTVIVGASGCGKSTALGLIEGFYFASQGSVRVFGHEVTASSARALRERMGFVDQECTVIDASVRVNLGLGLLRPPSDEEMVRALQRTGLWPCLRERSGLDTMLGIDGLEMSGGQRQRIAIARAVVRDPEILILDEPTSALDGIAESRVLDVLEDLPGGTTVIMSAHRLSTILRADWVVALDGGRVVGEGSHRDLIQGCAFYRDLVSHQAVGPRTGSPV